MLPCRDGRLDQQHMNLTQPVWYRWFRQRSLGNHWLLFPCEVPFAKKAKIFDMMVSKIGTLPLPSFLFSSVSLCPAHSHPLARLQMLQAHTPLGAIANAVSLCSRCSHFSSPPLLLLVLVKPLMSILHKASWPSKILWIFFPLGHSNHNFQLN